jgi:hypothetical protein
MSRRAHSFKQGDVTKAVKGAVAAGIFVERVEIAEGKIVVFAGGGQSSTEAPDNNEWDGVK